MTINKYSNFEDMVVAIKNHAKLHDSKIIQSDDSAQLLIGYSCEKTKDQWVIRLSDFKKTGLKYHSYFIGLNEKEDLLKIFNER